MKRTTLIALMAGVVVSFGSWAGAADQPAPKPNRPQVGAPAGRPSGDIASFWAQRLQLNDDQKAKVKPIFEDEMQKRREIVQDKNLSREDRMTKIRQLRETTGTKLKPILTAEQYSRWEKMGGMGRPAPAGQGQGQPKPKS